MRYSQRGLFTRFFTVALILNLTALPQAQGQEKVESQEVKREIERLNAVKAQVEALIKKNKELLRQIREERELLKRDREELERRIKEAEAQRYKKLAKVFEKMEPELAGQKISKMSSPKDAAYIIYNMKERKAGEVLNYVEPEMVNKIVKILTDIKTSSGDKS